MLPLYHPAAGHSPLRNNPGFGGPVAHLLYTQVNNGRFQVDMQFEDEAPEGIRRGQTLQIRLALSDETQAVLLNKGGFFQQTGGSWVYKVIFSL